VSHFERSKYAIPLKRDLVPHYIVPAAHANDTPRSTYIKPPHSKTYHANRGEWLRGPREHRCTAHSLDLSRAEARNTLGASQNTPLYVRDTHTSGDEMEIPRATTLCEMFAPCARARLRGGAPLINCKTRVSVGRPPPPGRRYFVMSGWLAPKAVFFFYSPLAAAAF